jgi:hypothetical protein
VERTTVRTRRAAEQGPPAARILAGAILLLGVVVASIGVMLMVSQVTQPGGTVPVLVDPDALALEEVAGLPPGTSLDPASDGSANAATGAPAAALALQVDQLPLRLRFLAGLPALVIGLSTLAGAVVLRSMLLTIASGRPFDARNPGRFRALGVVVLIWALAPGLVASGATVAVLEHLGDAEGSPLGFTILDLPITPLLGAAVLFVVAAVFDHGRRMSDDLAGLV